MTIAEGDDARGLVERRGRPVPMQRSRSTMMPRLPLELPERVADLVELGGFTRHLLGAADVCAVQKLRSAMTNAPGTSTAFEEDRQVDVRDDAVDADRERRQEQALRSRRSSRGLEGEGVGRVALLAERRAGVAPPTGDVWSRPLPPVRTVKTAPRDDADDGETARQPAEDAPPPPLRGGRGLRLGQDVAGRR